MRRVNHSFFSVLEAKRLISLGIPLFIAQMSSMGMTLADTIMTGQASSVDMAAVAVACSIWNPISLFGIGVLLAISPLSAQFIGDGQDEKAIHTMRQGFWCLLIMAIPLMLLFYTISFNMGRFGLDEQMTALSGGYLRAVLWGLPGFFIFVCVRCFVEGYSLTRPAMVISIMALSLNIPINYILIYGKFGFPAMGAVGCGVATAICFTFMAVCMTIFILYNDKFKHLRPIFSPLFSSKNNVKCFDGKTVWRIFRIGFPNAFAMLFEVSLFAASALALAPLGTLQVAGHQVAMTLTSTLFIIPLSLSATTTIRVGYYLGSGQYTHARLTAWTSLIIGILIACFTSLLVLFFKDQIVHIFNDELPVVELASSLLIYTAAFQIIDSFQIIGLGILRGYNDTRTISIISFVCYWIIGFPLGYILARTDYIIPSIGAAGFWSAFIVALTFASFCYLIRIVNLQSMSGSLLREKISQ